MYFNYVVFVCLQYKEGKKLKPKPNYNSVDLSEVEWEDTEEKVYAIQIKSGVFRFYFWDFYYKLGRENMLCWVSLCLYFML